MRYIHLILLLILCNSSIHSQPNVPSQIESSFTAIIVNDIDISIQWYKDILGYETLNIQKREDMGLRQANLSNEHNALELIELKSAQSTKELLSNFPPKTKIKGLFKFGFSVDHFDEWIDHLKHFEVNLVGSVVTDPTTNKKMVVLLDPDGNRIQLFEK